jgi:hypothetical protein
MVVGERKRDGQPPAERGRRDSGRFPVAYGGLVTDLCLWWESDAREVEVVLVTINGTIAGAFPIRVGKGERLPIHRRFVPQTGKATWYLRLAGDVAVRGLSVSVEVRDRRGRASATPICEGETLQAGRVTSVERTVPVPDELLA